MATVETPEIEFRAEARFVRTAPRKAQAVAAEIRGMPVGQARSTLAFMTRAAARDVANVLNSAIANAESHPTSSYDAESLYVSAAYVGSGPTLKRWQARARGRVGRIRKRTCHITVRLAPIPGATSVRPVPADRATAPGPQAEGGGGRAGGGRGCRGHRGGGDRRGSSRGAGRTRGLRGAHRAGGREEAGARSEGSRGAGRRSGRRGRSPRRAGAEAVAEDVPAAEAVAEDVPAEKPKRSTVLAVEGSRRGGADAARDA